MEKITNRPMRNIGVIRVEFTEPKDGQSVYYFSSLLDLFTQFTYDDLGTKLNRLYNQHRIKFGIIFTNERCKIERIEVIHYKKIKDNG